MRESPVIKMERLLKALDTLSEQEEMLVKDDLMDQAAEVRERVSLLVSSLDPLAASLRTQGLIGKNHRDQAARIMQRQRRSLALMQARSKDLKTQIEELSQARSKLTTLKHSYGKTPYAKKQREGGRSLEAHG